MIEFMPWYQTGQATVRCTGDEGCGALLLDGDIEVHRKWHEKIEHWPRPLPLPIKTCVSMSCLGLPLHAAHEGRDLH